MIYLLESNLPKNKPVFFTLTKIYGIGKSIARKTCKRIGFASNFKTKDLTPEQITIILRLIDSFDVLLNNQLKMLKFLTLKSLTAKKSYRGLRRTLGLPVRGQRTHTNARSAQRGKSKNTN